MIRKKLTARQYSNPLITGFRSRSLGPGDLKINKILGNYNLINYHVADNQKIISIGEKYFKEYSYKKYISLNLITMITLQIVVMIPDFLYI